jgi:hypothetical protein
LHKIEQELGTEIKPIPKVIDPRLYVAEYQNEDSYNNVKNGSEESTRDKVDSHKSSEFNKEYEKELQDKQPSLLQMQPLPQMIA